jgi:23S rRNA-/tRNA-specific pseudouridylate synthase
VIKGGDVLTHTVHRHEPGVAVYSKESPFVNIVDETSDVLVVDKPGTLPIHPCGGYHVQSLMNILEPIYGGKLYTIHRLDRLTSGLLILGKTSLVAQEWGKSIMNRNCQKVYLARVAGKFPLNAGGDASKLRLSGDSCPINGEWPEYATIGNSKSRDVAMERKRNAHGFWIINGKGQVTGNDVDLQRVFDSKFDEDDWLKNADSETDSESKEQMLWFHLACPTRIAKHKDGVCEAGSFETVDDDLYLKGVKPAQTSFGVVRYDPTTDSTVVVCKPVTGRTHQIRLHLQHLGHPIANDPNYGGEMWYGNADGQRVCQVARERLETIDQDNKADIERSRIGKVPVAPVASTISEPATEKEIQAGVSEAVRQETESIHDFIRRTCVWCARQQAGGINRDMLEFLIRSPGIWLHALKYSFTVSDGRSVSYRAPFPSWVQFDDL